ncbi:unnamed protein product [Phytophthora lilii]|uniref:Unnamed protein product n=1 Tax=Phytophthora lilii TaxID=2077276 RepID=A0A9W6TE61_9STRA|nr:unnamed protein product [Phytophthora lilii]
MAAACQVDTFRQRSQLKWSTQVAVEVVDIGRSNGGDKSMNEFAQKLLKKLSLAEDAVEAMDFDGKTYSYRVDNEVAYVCVTNAAFGKRCGI